MRIAVNNSTKKEAFVNMLEVHEGEERVENELNESKTSAPWGQ